MAPIHNEGVTLLTKLNQPLRIGSKIKISGCMTHGGDDRILINLQSTINTNPRDDAVLHLSIRPKLCNIVRNHYQNNAWGSEENSGHCPITPGQNYDIEITVGRESFAIAINGSHFCDFRYRLPFQRVNYINIQGQTTLNFVGLF